jgi:hypothetical protein
MYRHRRLQHTITHNELEFLCAREGRVSWYLYFVTLQIPMRDTLSQGTQGRPKSMCNGVCFSAYNVWTFPATREG